MTKLKIKCKYCDKVLGISLYNTKNNKKYKEWLDKLKLRFNVRHALDLKGVYTCRVTHRITKPNLEYTSEEESNPYNYD